MRFGHLACCQDLLHLQPRGSTHCRSCGCLRAWSCFLHAERTESDRRRTRRRDCCGCSTAGSDVSADVQTGRCGSLSSNTASVPPQPCNLSIAYRPMSSVESEKHYPVSRSSKAIHVTGHESVDEAKSVCGFVDALLLDSGDQELPVKQLGGTGRTHDWTLSRQIRNEVSVPVFLAGGISAVNVEKAVFAVRPFGLDLRSSVRSDGILDESKLKAFFSALWSIPSRHAKP